MRKIFLRQFEELILIKLLLQFIIEEHTHTHTHTHRHQTLSLTLSPSLFVTKDMKMHNVNARNRFNGIFDLQIHSLGFLGPEFMSSFHRLCDNEAQSNEISLTISFYQNINFQTIIITLLHFQHKDLFFMDKDTFRHPRGQKDKPEN